MTKDEIKAALKEAIEEHHSDFWVPAEKHYQHHQQMDLCQESKPEWEANHRFMSDVRKSGAVVKKTSWSILAAALIGWLIMVIFKGGGHG